MNNTIKKTICSFILIFFGLAALADIQNIMFLNKFLLNDMSIYPRGNFVPAWMVVRHVVGFVLHFSLVFMVFKQITKPFPSKSISLILIVLGLLYNPITYFGDYYIFGKTTTMFWLLVIPLEYVVIIGSFIFFKYSYPRQVTK